MDSSSFLPVHVFSCCVCVLFKHKDGLFVFIVDRTS